MHITLVAQRIILVVVFDERSSLGLVRLRVKKAGQKLSGAVRRDLQARRGRVDADGPASPFAEISDEDIDNLFSD